MDNTLKKIFEFNTDPKFEPINTSLDTFEIFNNLSCYYNDIFIYESLDGPKELIKSSIIGFEPKYKIKCMSTYISIYNNRKLIAKVSSKDPLKTLDENFPTNNNKAYRYVGGLAGYICYESIKYWEKIKVKKHKNFPLMEFGLYDDGIIYDHDKSKLEYFYYGKSRLKKVYRILTKSKIREKKFLSFSDIKRNTNKEDFEEKVKRVKKFLEKGDVFQAVLSKKIMFKCKGNPLLMYKELRKINPSPYMFFIRMDSRTLLGSSPEMLLRITDNMVESYPIAGSRPVLSDRELTEKHKNDLLNNAKEIAEHTMLVDLARNDLGRVCKFGTVKTPQLMKIKQFSHIQHLVSHVIGNLNSEYSAFDAFKAVFPAGTVTGAPKIRAMEIISELEADSRGPYAGAVGYFSLNGSCDFAITIRSLFISGNKGYNQSGAGIVIDSNPKKEYIETEDKSNAILSSLRVFEENVDRKFDKL